MKKGPASTFRLPMMQIEEDGRHTECSLYEYFCKDIDVDVVENRRRFALVNSGHYEFKFTDKLKAMRWW